MRWMGFGAVIWLATPEHIDTEWFAKRVADALAQLIRDTNDDEDRKTVQNGGRQSGQVAGTARLSVDAG